ncbi:MAG: hypothetical protein QOG21_2455 [Actinomycetota bacterium]|jgi:hypothetical protein|nr:hypothetical protein [Actinomycetota bacterium]
MIRKHHSVAGLKRHRGWLALSLMGMVAGLLVVPVAANAAALTTVNWAVSNNQVSATGVTYSYSFKTATAAGVVGKVVFTVSGAGLAGVPAITKTYGIGAGTVARVGQVITYTVTAPVAIAAGIPIYIELSGLTNGTPAGSYTTSVATQTAGAVAIDGPTTSNAVVYGGNNTAVTVTIDKSLTFTVDTTAFELDMDPSLPALADQSQAVGITVQTNANSGYTLAVNDNAAGLISAASGTPTIADVSSSKATSVVWPATPAFGYRVTATGATADSAFNGTKWAGYVAGGDQVASHATATGGTPDTITITNRVAIDFSVQATTFTDTITYTATPNYT